MAETLSTPGGRTVATSWQEKARAAFGRRDLLLALLPPAALFLLVALLGVDLPYYDQWELAPRFLAWSDGHFPWQAIWERHNEHRLILPQLIMLCLGRLTGWDIRFELAINLLLAAATFLVLALQLGRSLDGDRRFSALLPLLSLIVFSPSQWGNWSWGWQIQIFLAMLLVAAGILLLDTRPRTPLVFLGATLCAALAPFCFANGLLLFPLGLPLVLREKSRRYLWTGLWLAAGGLVYWIYGAAGVGRRAVPGESALERLETQLNYLLHYLAGPILNRPGVVTLVAHLLVPLSFLLLAWIVWRHRGRWEAMLPWLTLAAFGLASAAMTAYGRYTFGIGQALSTRYFTIANFYWLGLAGVAVVALRSAPRFRAAKAAFAGLALCLLAGAAIGVRDFAADSRQKRELRALLRAESETSAEVAAQVPFPDAETVRQRIETVRRLELSLFRD
jgi:hypothetical protein